MSPGMLEFDPVLARAVQAPTMTPRQQPTASRLKTRCDYREQTMLKHPHPSEFHSRAEHLHAALLEADPTVYAYVPQPYALKVGGKPYTPDCYVATNGAPRRVVELRPDGALGEELGGPMAAFCARAGMHFEVLANEAVLERAIEAENWLKIVSLLHVARDLDTGAAELAVLERLASAGPCTLGDVIDPGDFTQTRHVRVEV